jgi:SIR2-like domain
LALSDILPQPLLEDIIENRCIPIIGAGFSRNAKTDSGKKMPLWSEVAKHFSNQLGSDYNYLTPLDPISDFCEKFGKPKAVEQLRILLHIGKVKPGGAHTAFADLPFDLVITTNYDFLLEDSYTARNRQYYPILSEDQLSTSSLGKSDEGKTTRILKIHGDLNNSGNMIITEEDYDTYVEKHPLMATYIANLLITKTPLFIGYSMDDPDFRGIWSIVRSRLGKFQRIGYALSARPSISTRAKFERRGIRVISLGGDD